jgi:hypothetical protein
MVRGRPSAARGAVHGGSALHYPILSRRGTGRARVALLAVAWMLGAGCAPPPASRPAPELWFYQVVNLAERDVVDRVAPIWTRAARAGYRRVVLADHKFGRLGDMSSDYFERAARLRALADSLGLGIVPGVFQVGRSNALLAGDPNLVEALPVAAARFEVHGGVARLVPDPPVAFGDPPAGRDGRVRLDGRLATIRPGVWRARWWYDVAVSPHRCYHVSWSVRTRGFAGRPFVRVLAGGRAIHFMRSMRVEATQDWTSYDLMFDSLEHSSVRVYFGVWQRTRGGLEWRDWSIEEAGPVNLVRRDDAPFVLRDEATGSTLTEGVDFSPVVDSLMGQFPWAGQFTEWHAAPQIRVKRPDGTRLRGSWHHAGLVLDSQVTCCLSEPATFARLEDEARRMRALWGPGRYLMMFDEIRVLGRDSACVRTGLGAGAILSRAVRRCADLLPQDTLYVWGDMFDPRQNAVRDFFLVPGDLAGSWEGLESRVGIVNWNSSHARESLRFFAERGHRQVIAGYYDGRPEDIRLWLMAARGVPSLEAILYATWRARYDDLEAFARACR